MDLALKGGAGGSASSSTGPVETIIGGTSINVSPDSENVGDQLQHFENPTSIPVSQLQLPPALQLAAASYSTATNANLPPVEKWYYIVAALAAVAAIYYYTRK